MCSERERGEGESKGMARECQHVINRFPFQVFFPDETPNGVNTERCKYRTVQIPNERIPNCPTRLSLSRPVE